MSFFYAPQYTCQCPHGMTHTITQHPGFVDWIPTTTTTTVGWVSAEVSLAVDTPESARAAIESWTWPWNPFPGEGEKAELDRISQGPECLKAVVKALKERLKLGSDYAYRALTLLEAIPADALADLHDELATLSDGVYFPGYVDISTFMAQHYLPQAAVARQRRDEADKKRKWEVWGSGAALPPPPDDSAFALPLQRISVPKDEPKGPPGWTWMLVPESQVGYWSWGGGS